LRPDFDTPGQAGDVRWRPDAKKPRGEQHPCRLGHGTHGLGGRGSDLALIRGIDIRIRFSRFRLGEVRLHVFGTVDGASGHRKERLAISPSFLGNRRSKKLKTPFVRGRIRE